MTQAFVYVILHWISTRDPNKILSFSLQSSLAIDYIPEFSIVRLNNQHA